MPTQFTRGLRTTSTRMPWACSMACTHLPPYAPSVYSRCRVGALWKNWSQIPFNLGATQYIYLPTASGPMPIAAILNGRKYAVHTDHLNTPRRLSQANGLVVWQWAYSAFGQEQPTKGSDRFVNPQVTPNAGSTNLVEVNFNLRYPGQYFDRESGLSYNYYRSYDARTGRYSQTDPIGLQGGWNRFTYVEGNPVLLTDPTGLTWIYQQSTGNLYHQPTNPSSATLVGVGYAGHGVGVNNPALEGVPNIGPIPQGNYTIGSQQTITTSSGTVLPGAMRLAPDANNWMLGRSGFIIHGGNMQSRTSSEGCIIQPPGIRNQIGNSGDRTLRVVP